MPHAAAVQRDARIAQAEANRLATEAEQQAAARMAEATRDSEILQAGYQAERDKAAAKARQAGPLADAAARQEVVVQETRVAELEAHRREQQLQADVRKPADAKAYEKRTLAEAERDARISAAQAKAKETELAAAAEATRVTTAAAAEAEATKARGAAAATATRATGEAEAAAAQAKGLAEAEATRAKGLAEAEAHQGAGRRARREPGGGGRPATRRELAGDRRGGRVRVRQRRHTWCCSTAPTAWRTCSPRRSRWAARAWAWPAPS